jgi:hypothetical protein
MQLPKYEANTARWDEYRRFYNKPAKFFVRFETGEAIILTDTFEPSDRRALRDSDLRIAGTTDEDCPRLKLDPKAPDYEATKRAMLDARQNLLKVYDNAIPKVWLTDGGAQTLLIDTTTKRTVRLSSSMAHHHEAWANVPAWVRGATRYYIKGVAYIPGDNCNAIASKIYLSVPYIPSADERADREYLLDACKAWCTMIQYDTKYAPDWWKTEKNSHKYLYQHPYDVAGDVPAIEDLRPEQRFQIAKFGYARRYKPVPVDHLIAV